MKISVFLEAAVTYCQAPAYSWFVKCCKSASPRHERNGVKFGLYGAGIFSVAVSPVAAAGVEKLLGPRSALL